ncbi:hypothetical protein BASA81_009846 [Batrachochytrium salamandrivorans]|nr:hypothetical protein BASA81_009846 [Batrachochytrium salamandrivorans]
MLRLATASSRQANRYQQRRMFSGHGHGEPAVFDAKDLVLPAAYLFAGVSMLTVYIKCAYAKTRVLDAQLSEQRQNGELERDDRILAVYKQ